MKLTSLVMTALIATSSATVLAEDFDYQTDLEVNTYETLYFSDGSDAKEAFKLEAYDSRTNEMIQLPFGQVEYPHAAMAKVTRNKMINGAFGISNVTSAFSSTQEEVKSALESKLRGGMIGADEDMIFLDHGMTIVDDAVNASFVVIPNVLKKTLDSLTDVGLWNECSDRNFTGNYSGFNCSKRRGINDDFKKFLDRNVLRCVNSGLSKTGKGKASAIHIVHGGIAGDKRHSPRSLHAVMRAIDIRTIIATTKRGKVSMSYPKAAQGAKTERAFYEAFHRCWSDSNISRDSACRKKAGSNGLVGIIRWEHKNHRKHVHASMPFCRSSKYFSK